MVMLFYILSLYGITLIISEGVIFSKFRKWLNTFNNKFFYKLVSCMMCLGFWFGAITSLILNDNPFIDITHLFNYNVFKYVLNPILFGGFISGTNWLLHLIQLNLEKQISDEL